MFERLHTASTALGLAGAFGLACGTAGATVCRPSVSKPIVVASAAQRLAAGARVRPPIGAPFDWPDTPLGVIKTASGYTFFGSDGDVHANGTYGSIVATAGTLDDPLGTGVPLDVSIAPNPDRSVDPNYPSYGYLGGGPVFRVPPGMPGAGNLLATYHAELPNDALYAALGLAASSDNGAHWTDLGEIVRLNQSYAPGLDGFEIGDGPLVLSRDGSYFYLYFPDWLANGTPHPGTSNVVSVARAPAAALLRAAFAETPQHAIPFQKFYRGSWDLQPAIGGASSDLDPASPYAGYLDIHADPPIGRYVMIVSNDTSFGYAESPDGLAWTVPVPLGTYGPIAAYPTAVGLGDDPRILGTTFYVYYTDLPTDGSGWTNGTLRRLTISCDLSRPR
jgi:hypothetical protein